MRESKQKMKGGSRLTLILLSFALPFNSFAATNVKEKKGDDDANTRRFDATLKLRPSRTTVIAYSSPKLESTMLLDRWNFLLENSHSHLDQEFEKLLNEAKNSSKKVKLAKKTHPPNSVTVTSLLLSTSISLIAILGVTCASSLSIILCNLPMIPFLSRCKKSTTVQYSNIRGFITKRLIPKAFRVTYKMVLMDFWRNLWLEMFVSLRDLYYNINGVSYYETIWERYAPGWLRRGVRAYIVKNIQNEFQFIFGSWISSGVGLMTTSTWLDESMIGDTLIDGDLFGVDDDSGGIDEDSLVSDELDADLNAEDPIDVPDIELDEALDIIDVPDGDDSTLDSAEDAN